MPRLFSSRFARMVGLGELLVAFGIVIFWVLFFTVDLVTIPDPDLRKIYMGFEYSFVLPDFILSIILVVSAQHLFKRKRSGFILSLIAGSVLIFLGLLDISFNTRHHIYGMGIVETVFNGTINVLCIVFGVFLVYFSSRFLLLKQDTEAC